MPLDISPADYILKAIISHTINYSGLSSFKSQLPTCYFSFLFGPFISTNGAPIVVHIYLHLATSFIVTFHQFDCPFPD